MYTLYSVREFVLLIILFVMLQQLSIIRLSYMVSIAYHGKIFEFV